MSTGLSLKGGNIFTSGEILSSFFCFLFGVAANCFGLLIFLGGEAIITSGSLVKSKTWSSIDVRSIGSSLSPLFILSILVALVIVGIFNRSQGSSRLSMDSRCSYSWIRSRYFYFKFKRTTFFLSLFCVISLVPISLVPKSDICHLGAKFLPSTSAKALVEGKNFAPRVPKITIVVILRD